LGEHIARYAGFIEHLVDTGLMVMVTIIAGTIAPRPPPSTTEPSDREDLNCSWRIWRG
jgi:hypothetical protein